MKIDLKPGTYIVAVSGGVDSISLLSLINNNYSKNPDFRFIVAHFDHGIRQDSDLDLKLVRKTAKSYGFEFVFEKANLGPKTSEETARKHRYEFLFGVSEKYQAGAILTAHHKNDLIETAVFNVLRGTGRKGLTSLGSRDLIIRPLLKFSKAQILRYANKHQLAWREDITNTDLKYSRNLIREELLKKFSTAQTKKLESIIKSQHSINQELDNLLDEFLDTIADEKTIKRQAINSLPDNLASEIIAHWLRKNNLRDFDKKTIQRILSGSRIGTTGSKYDVKHGYFVIVQKEVLALDILER